MDVIFNIFISISPLVVIYKMLKTKNRGFTSVLNKSEEQFYLSKTLNSIFMETLGEM